jgi:hypothetical protein
MLLRPFAVEWLTPAHAGALAALAARYGESWHWNLLDAWFGSRNTWQYTGDVDRKGWAGALPGLTASWGWLDHDIRLWLRQPSPATGASNSRSWASRSPDCWRPPTGRRWPTRS